MENVLQNGQKVSQGETKSENGEFKPLPLLSKLQVRNMVSADMARMRSLLDIIYGDPLLFDAVVDAVHRRYENLREAKILEKNQGELFKKGVDEQSE